MKTVNKLKKAKQYCDKPYEADYINNKLSKVYTSERITSRATTDPTAFYKGEFDTLLLNKSSENLKDIKSKSIDFILTDPPYYDNLNYSELSDFYYQWIKRYIQSDLNHNPLNESLQIGDDYETDLVNVFKECNRVLKEDGLMAFSYHHNKQEAWNLMGKAIRVAGFRVANIIPIRSEGNSAYHSEENSIKWDSIIVLRKNCNGIIEEHREENKRSINEWNDVFDKYGIKDEKLILKECDRKSFFRSLEMAEYINKDEPEFNLLEPILS